MSFAIHAIHSLGTAKEKTFSIRMTDREAAAISIQLEKGFTLLERDRKIIERGDRMHDLKLGLDLLRFIIVPPGSGLDAVRRYLDAAALAGTIKDAAYRIAG